MPYYISFGTALAVHHLKSRDTAKEVRSENFNPFTKITKGFKTISFNITNTQ